MSTPPPNTAIQAYQLRLVSPEQAGKMRLSRAGKRPTAVTNTEGGSLPSLAPGIGYSRPTYQGDRQTNPEPQIKRALSDLLQLGQQSKKPRLSVPEPAEYNSFTGHRTQVSPGQNQAEEPAVGPGSASGPQSIEKSPPTIQASRVDHDGIQQITDSDPTNSTENGHHIDAQSSGRQTIVL